MIWYDMIWYDMIWYDMIWYDIISYTLFVHAIRKDIYGGVPYHMRSKAECDTVRTIDVFLIAWNKQGITNLSFSRHE